VNFFEYYKEIFSLALEGASSFVLSKIKQEIIVFLATFICFYVFYEKGKTDALEQSIIKTISFVIIYVFILFTWNVFNSPVKLNKAKEKTVNTLTTEKETLEKELEEKKERKPYFVIKAYFRKCEKNTFSLVFHKKNEGEDSFKTKFSLLFIDESLSIYDHKETSIANVLKNGEERYWTFDDISIQDNVDKIYFILIAHTENRFKKPFNQIQYLKWNGAKNGSFRPDLFDMRNEEKKKILDKLGDTLIYGKRLIDIDKESDS